MLDAPVSGSIPQDADTLTLIGGDEQAYERVADTVS
jgi:3-hydroxyisobutyrate dehydrogenase-like beta-hydroxyacid dehydrogenase